MSEEGLVLRHYKAGERMTGLLTAPRDGVYLVGWGKMTPISERPVRTRLRPSWPTILVWLGTALCIALGPAAVRAGIGYPDGVIVGLGAGEILRRLRV